MDVNGIIAALDSEIATLKQARAVLAAHRGSVDKVPTKKRHLSPEGRAQIVAALKKRWAKKKRAK